MCILFNRLDSLSSLRTCSTIPTESVRSFHISPIETVLIQIHLLDNYQISIYLDIHTHINTIRAFVTLFFRNTCLRDSLDLFFGSSFNCNDESFFWAFSEAKPVPPALPTVITSVVCYFSKYLIH